MQTLPVVSTYVCNRVSIEKSYLDGILPKEVCTLDRDFNWKFPAKSVESAINGTVIPII